MTPDLQSARVELRCPRCLGKDIVPSMPRGILDALMRRWGRIPRHCRKCGRRFYARLAKPPVAAKPVAWE